MWLMSSQARHLRRTQLEVQSSYFLRSLSVSNRVRARAARQRAQGAFAQLAGTTRDRAGGHAPHGRRRVPAAWAANPENAWQPGSTPCISRLMWHDHLRRPRLPNLESGSTCPTARLTRRRRRLLIRSVRHAARLRPLPQGCIPYLTYLPGDVRRIGAAAHRVRDRWLPAAGSYRAARCALQNRLRLLEITFICSTASRTHRVTIPNGTSADLSSRNFTISSHEEKLPRASRFSTSPLQLLPPSPPRQPPTRAHHRGRRRNLTR